MLILLNNRITKLQHGRVFLDGLPHRPTEELGDIQSSFNGRDFRRAHLRLRPTTVCRWEWRVNWMRRYAVRFCLFEAIQV